MIQFLICTCLFQCVGDVHIVCLNVPLSTATCACVFCIPQGNVWYFYSMQQSILTTRLQGLIAPLVKKVT